MSYLNEILAVSADIAQSFIGYALLFLLAASILGLPLLYVTDRLQTKSTLRRNYPVLAHFRYLLEYLGSFLRQYFFAMDREEMPFNRAQRSWIYRAAKNVDSTVAFGSSRDLRPSGTVYFANCAFPPLDLESAAPQAVEIGPYCACPYKASSIFNISGMSYGALSAPAVKALSFGAGMAGCWLNTGEGGLSDHHLRGDADIVYQIGTAKFGVCRPDGGFDEEKLEALAAHKNVKMFELKVSQGAKPGKGGILPGEKVTEEIAAIRGIPVGVDAFSPNRHPEIANMSDLLDMINYIRDVTQKPVGFKMVVGHYHFFEDMATEIERRGIEKAPDFITIDSADGGTGAAPMSLIDNMGIPIHESLPLTVKTLTRLNLRDRIKICASGKLINPSEVAWAYCAGADFVTSARGFMFALGCIQSLHCNKNTCPTGIATHDEDLQRGLNPRDKATRVANYIQNMEREVRFIAHSCGVKDVRDLQPHHARIVQPDGSSINMDILYQT